MYFRNQKLSNDIFVQVYFLHNFRRLCYGVCSKPWKIIKLLLTDVCISKWIYFRISVTLFTGLQLIRYYFICCLLYIPDLDISWFYFYTFLYKMQIKQKHLGLCHELSYIVICKYWFYYWKLTSLFTIIDHISFCFELSIIK